MNDHPLLDWLAPTQTEKEERADGSFVLRSGEALRPYARCIGDWIEHWSQATPDSIVLAERGKDGAWRKLSWRALRAHIGAMGQALLDLLDDPIGRARLVERFTALHLSLRQDCARRTAEVLSELVRAGR